MRIHRRPSSPDLDDHDRRIAGLRGQKEEALQGQQFERAAQVRDQERALLAERLRLEAELSPGMPFSVIDEEQIAEVLAQWTGIPVQSLTEEETSKLLRMEDDLHKRIVGQHEAIVAVSRAIRRTRAGLKDPKRPAGSFIFLGPSGVGKTETAKALAEFLFGNENALIQLDMSEYMEKHTVSRLVGSPPGYVGYDEGGQLTEAVRRKPYSVILFDEIEKAHPDVFNVLLQILEEGRLTDAQGRKVDFKNTIVIMTSNVGARDIVKGQSLGFVVDDGAGLSHKILKERVTGELKRLFRPEFLNRVDEVIVFHALTDEDIGQIVDLMVARLREQLVAMGIGISLGEPARRLLAKEGFDASMGARPLRRAIQRLVEDPLSEQLLAAQWKPGDIVELAVEDETIVFHRGEGTFVVPELDPEAAAAAGGAAPSMPRRSPRARGGAAAGGSAVE